MISDAERRARTTRAGQPAGTAGNGRGKAEHCETVIIGAGQCGLATAYHLNESDRECVILDADGRVGDTWRRRWPSLRLYSPARYDGLPGMSFPAPALSYPSAHEMADYLESYAARLKLPVRSGVKVDGLSKDGNRYLVSAGGRRLQADNVVVATGLSHEPIVPDFAGELDPAITQLHSAGYRGPEQLRDGPVLVVGASHSGADIAHEVAAERETVLSGRETGQLPFRIDGPVARHLALRMMRLMATRVLTVRTPMGRKVRAKVRSQGAPLLRYRSGELRAAGVERVPERTVGVVDGQPVLDGGRVVEAANVIWCTGFRNRYDWIRCELPLGDDGFPRQKRGVVASSPGLYFVGLRFLDSFSSMLVLGAGRDAKRVAQHIASKRAPRVPG